VIDQLSDIAEAVALERAIDRHTYIPAHRRNAPSEPVRRARTNALRDAGPGARRSRLATVICSWLFYRRVYADPTVSTTPRRRSDA
jgi:hypothetical protein